MFYENVDCQFASFHTNNNSHVETKTDRSSNLRRVNIVLLGDRNVGKSKLIRLLVDRVFEKKKRQTSRNSLNLIYQDQDRAIDERLHVKFSSIDLTRANIDELFLGRTQRIDCLLLVYDLSNVLSLSHLIEYCPLILRHDSVFLVGLVHHRSLPREIHREQLKLFVKKYALISYEIDLNACPHDFFKEICDRFFSKSFT